MTTSVRIIDCLNRAEQLKLVSESPRLDIEVLLAHILEKNRTYLYTWPEKHLSDEQASAFERAFARRLAGEPVAHITGRREFWSLSLRVDNTTLIPRPDTELLVELVLELTCDDSPEQVRRVLDLGTGTGAIVLALASEKVHWQLLGVDSEPAAVELARSNRDELGLVNVELVQSDWFEALLPGERFDFVVSNPPYIDAADEHLQQGDVRFEPRSALVAAERGLADIAHIVRDARHFLLPGGWVLLEHGWQQAEAVRALLMAAGYVEVQTRCDLAGRERVSLGRVPEEDSQ